MLTIALDSTRRGHPAIWEKGGGYTNTGHAQIVAGPNGEPLRPIYVRRRGHRANGRHALFPVSNGMVVVKASHYHQQDFRILVLRIKKVRKTEVGWVADIETICDYDEGVWIPTPPKELEAAIKAAKEKATCYHCRSPHYVTG